MEERKIYNTLRIRWNNEVKLFPSRKIQTIDDLKNKAITRFDLLMKNDEFDMEYFDEDLKGVLALEKINGTDRINEAVLLKLINKKIELQIVKKQPYSEKEMRKKYGDLKESKQKEKRYQQLCSELDELMKPEKQLKHYAQCDKCLIFPIIGIRYKCMICDDFDLCEKCYTKLQQTKRTKCHSYMKIRSPIDHIKTIKVYFNEKDIEKMDQNCKQVEIQTQILQKDFSKLQIDQSSLPHKKVLSQNFVQTLFNKKCAKKLYKVHPSIQGAYGSPLSIDQCS